MAERRMFSKGIISSGKFLKMPPTARLLYYDLGMAADDDGVVEAYTVMVTTRANEDDLRVLVAKGYVRILNEELVTYICDWNTNNYIRGDRYHESQYKDLILKLNTCDQAELLGIPDDNHCVTEVRLGKDSIGKDSIGDGTRTDSNYISVPTLNIDSVQESKNIKEPTKRFNTPSIEEIKECIKEKGYVVDAERFFYYYESNGWKVGKNPMKNWRAALAQWNSKDQQDKQSKPAPKQTAFNTFQQSDTDYASVIERKMLQKEKEMREKYGQ